MFSKVTYMLLINQLFEEIILCIQSALPSVI